MGIHKKFRKETISMLFGSTNSFGFSLCMQEKQMQE
jgi:hypothetical protein